MSTERRASDETRPASAKYLERGIAAPDLREVRREADRALRRLSQVAQILISYDDAGRVLPLVARILRGTLPVRSVVLAVWPASHTTTAVWRTDDVSPRELRITRSHALRWCEYLAGDPAWAARDLVMGDTTQPRLSRASERFRARGESLVTLPVIAPGGRVLGALQVESERPPTEGDVAFVAEVASLFGAALHRRAAGTSSAEQRALREARRERDEILAIVAHDLRNPLAIVTGGAALLVSLPPESGDRRDRTVRAIQRAARRMQRLVGDLLDDASIEGRRLSIELVREPAEKLVREAVEIALESLPAGRRLSITSELGDAGGADVICDHERILQVFCNLIGNATKFTGDGGSVRVGTRSEGDDVVFWVADDGPGIPPDHLPHVFDRYWQPPSTPRRSGIGLGLSIAKGIVEHHGGRIWAESRVGVGSTFYFTLLGCAGWAEDS